MRKLMTMYKDLHLRYNIDRLCVKKKGGEDSRVLKIANMY